MVGKSKPLVSIIMLTFNNFTRLRESLISILRQDYPNIELIISDDCSVEFPSDLVTNLINNNKKDNLSSFQTIINKENLGTVKNLNNSIKASHGEFIFTLGAGDLFVDQNSVSNVINVFLETNCDVIFTSRILYKNNKLYEVLPHVADWKNINRMDTKMSMYTSLMKTQHFSMFIGVTMVSRKAVIENHNYYDENYRLLEDLPMIEKVIWNNNVVLCPNLTTILYEGASGVSAKGHVNPILQKDLDFYNKHGRLEHYKSLDTKTQKHIDFGIKRCDCTSVFQLIGYCFKYAPRIIDWKIYGIKRFFAGYKDKNYLKTIKLDDYKSFLS